MNKNTKTAGVAITTLGLLFSLYIAFSIGNTSLAHLDNDNFDSQYVLNLGSEKNRSNIAKSISMAANPNAAPGDGQTNYFDAVTQNGNIIKFGYSNIHFSPYYNPNANSRSWGTFQPNATLYNAVPLNGLATIQVDFADNEDLNLAYGWFDDETNEPVFEIESIQLNENNSIFTFFEDGPDIFKLYNNSNKPVSLSDIVIEYSCFDTVNPYCAPTANELVFDYVPVNNEFSISGYKGTDVDIVIPAKVFDGVNSANVTKIDDNAFKNYYLESITMSNTITEIGDNAFYNCTSLNTITFPNGLEVIGDNAFYACGQLTNVVIPNSVTSIGKNAFKNNYLLTSISLPNYLQSIDDSTFENCQSLTSIELPNTVTHLGANAFKNCYNLSSVTLSNNLTTIGANAFESCQQLATINIPNTVTSIGDRAFAGCGALTKVTLPHGVETLGNNAFNNCWSLSTVIIPTSLQTVSSNTFSNIVWNAKLFYEGSSLPNSIKNSLKNMLSKIYFYSETPNTDGRHWRYVSGEPVIW